MKGKYLLIGV